MAKKKSTFWREYGIGIVSSITASVIVAVVLGSQIRTLKAEIETLKRQ